jgi:ribonuclease D
LTGSRRSATRSPAKISIEPTLIANRAQLSQIARDPRKLGEILLPWQASLLAEAPSLKA